jgi:hypothetical protein
VRRVGPLGVGPRGRVPGEPADAARRTGSRTCPRRRHTLWTTEAIERTAVIAGAKAAQPRVLAFQLAVGPPPVLSRRPESRPVEGAGEWRQAPAPSKRAPARPAAPGPRSTRTPGRRPVTAAALRPVLVHVRGSDDRVADGGATSTTRLASPGRSPVVVVAAHAGHAAPRLRLGQRARCCRRNEVFSGRGEEILPGRAVPELSPSVTNLGRLIVMSEIGRLSHTPLIPPVPPPRDAAC